MNRAGDEQVLAWIRARAAGRSSAEIAVAAGITAERVRTATARVMQADLAESGEDRATVAAAYWDTGTGPRGGGGVKGPRALSTSSLPGKRGAGCHGGPPRQEFAVAGGSDPWTGPEGAARCCEAPDSTSLLDSGGGGAAAPGFLPLSGGPSTCGQTGESAPQAERHERRMGHPSAVVPFISEPAAQIAPQRGGEGSGLPFNRRGGASGPCGDFAAVRRATVWG